MYNKISFCTVSMNRLHHLKQTLPKNINDNISYPSIEFILLDYSSTDGLENWVKSDMSDFVEQGLLFYYRFDHATFFDRSHSRNLIFKLSTGDIICNVDADNYLGAGFSDYINNVFNSRNDLFLVPDTRRKYYYIRDALGRFCARKQDFIGINGYDEKMSGYGFEDDDLYRRLSESGKSEEIILDKKYLQTIKHGDQERIGNEFFTNYFDRIFINFSTFSSSEVILLYKNGNYQKGTIIPNKTSAPSPAILKDLCWEEGKWNETENSFFLNNDSMMLSFFKTSDGDLTSPSGDIFYRIIDPLFHSQLPYQLPLITNYGHYLLNQKDGKKVNENGFGMGSVYKNFTGEIINV